MQKITSHHFCQPRTESLGCSGHGLTKTGQMKTGWIWPGLMNPDFCQGTQMVGSEFDANKMDSRTPVQAGRGGVMEWGMFSWLILGPLIPINHHLNATDYLSVVAEHVHSFMATICWFSNGYFQHDNAHDTKQKSSQTSFMNRTMSFLVAIPITGS